MQTPETIKKPVGNIRVYGCGGTGVKIASMFEPMRNQPEPGIANVLVTYVDTAFSDLNSDVKTKDCYLLRDTDGSGGLRRELAEEIMNSISELVQLHEPEDLNIVISSGSGGSGSVIAPSVTSELIRQGKQVISVVIGDAHTAQWMNNTMGTIRSYNGISGVRGQTVPLAYFENTSENTEASVNIQVAQLVTGLSALWSRQNQGLDSKDLEHFLNPEKITDFPPQLAMIKLYVKEIPKIEEQNIMTVVSLAKNREESRLNFVAEAQYTGIGPQELADTVRNLSPLHLCMLDQSFHDLMDELANKARTAKQARTRSTKTSFMGETPMANNGLIV